MKDKKEKEKGQNKEELRQCVGKDGRYKRIVHRGLGGMEKQERKDQKEWKAARSYYVRRRKKENQERKEELGK